MSNASDEAQESDVSFNSETLDEVMNEDFVTTCLNIDWGFTDEDLKILCRIRPCQVDMTKQNYYYAYEQDRVRLITERYGTTIDKKEILDFVHHRFMLKFQERYKRRISDPLKEYLEIQKTYGLAYSKFASSLALQRYAWKSEKASEDQQDEDEMSSSVTSPVSDFSTGTVIHRPSQSQGSQQKHNSVDNYDFICDVGTQSDQGSASQSSYSEFNKKIEKELHLVTSTQKEASI